MNIPDGVITIGVEPRFDGNIYFFFGKDGLIENQWVARQQIINLEKD